MTLKQRINLRLQYVQCFPALVCVGISAGYLTPESHHWTCEYVTETAAAATQTVCASGQVIAAFLFLCEFDLQEWMHRPCQRHVHGQS